MATTNAKALRSKRSADQRRSDMAEETLKGLKIAILVTDGFEQVELTEPRKALDQAGAETRVVSPKAGRVRGWKFTDLRPMR
jgi:hypothetical protein